MMAVIRARRWSVLLVALSLSCCLAAAGQGRGQSPDNALRDAVRIDGKRQRSGDKETPGARENALKDVLANVDGENELSELLWEKLQHRVLHHLARIERQLMEEVEDRTSRLNNSVTINYLYKVYQYLIEEVEIGKRIGEMRAAEIEKVRKLALEQGKELVSLENSVQALSRLVNNLTQSVKDFRIDRDTVGDRNELTSAPPRTTTPFRIRPEIAVDCQEVYQLGGMKYDGDYYIKIRPYLAEQPFEVCCRMANNAGWTLIQRRQDGSVDFFRNWEEYKRGFGDPRGEFWLGNDHIYELTNQDDYKLRIEMSDFDGRRHYAEYDHFRIADESNLYRIHVHGYHGDGGDSLTPPWSDHDGEPFSTYDEDNDARYYDNCAERFHGAWWFKSCFESHLNGVYYHRGEHDDYFKQDGIQWNAVGHHYSLQSVAMMIKPNKRGVEPLKRDGRPIRNDIH